MLIYASNNVLVLCKLSICNRSNLSIILLILKLVYTIFVIQVYICKVSYHLGWLKMKCDRNNVVM